MFNFSYLRKIFLVVFRIFRVFVFSVFLVFAKKCWHYNVFFWIFVGKLLGNVGELRRWKNANPITLWACPISEMQTLPHFWTTNKSEKMRNNKFLGFTVFADTAMFFLHFSRIAETTILFFHFQGNYWLFVVFVFFCLLFFDTTMDLLMFSKKLLTLLRFSKINKNRKKQKKGNFQKSTKRFSVFIFKLPRKDLRHNFLNIIFRRSGGL